MITHCRFKGLMFWHLPSQHRNMVYWPYHNIYMYRYFFKYTFKNNWLEESSMIKMSIPVMSTSKWNTMSPLVFVFNLSIGTLSSRFYRIWGYDLVEISFFYDKQPGPDHFSICTPKVKCWVWGVLRHLARGDLEQEELNNRIFWPDDSS